MNELLNELTAHIGRDILERLLQIIGDTTDAEDILEQALFDLTERGITADVLLKEFESGKFGWNHDCFTKQKEDEIEQNQFLTNPVNVQEGVLECVCGSRKVLSFTKQSRSADESTSVYAKCVACNRKWKE